MKLSLEKNKTVLKVLESNILNSSGLPQDRHVQYEKGNQI